jgi:hypothetical protein
MSRVAQAGRGDFDPDVNHCQGALLEDRKLLSVYVGLMWRKDGICYGDVLVSVRPLAMGAHGDVGHVL